MLSTGGQLVIQTVTSHPMYSSSTRAVVVKHLHDDSSVPCGDDCTLRMPHGGVHTTRGSHTKASREMQPRYGSSLPQATPRVVVGALKVVYQDGPRVLPRQHDSDTEVFIIAT